MKVQDAVTRAEGSENVQKMKGYFLGSVFASLGEVSDVNEWTLLYYNPANKMVVDCLVNDRFVTVGEETPAINELQKLDMDNVDIGIEKALATATKSFKKKIITILISLHLKDFSGKTYTVWTIALVTADMSATSVDVDAATGKILKEDTTRLIRKV